MNKALWLVTFLLAAPAALAASLVALVVTIPQPETKLVQGQVLSAATQVYESNTSDISSVSQQIITSDARALIIHNYLKEYASPLEPFADEVVKTGDKYGVNPNLLVAIAQQESNLCKKIPPESHNCWGFGIYGDKITRFSSYPEAIDTVTATLKNKYIDQGLDTPEEIMRRYTPASVENGGSWAIGVNQFLDELQ